MKKINLTIPKPCHENWDQMSPAEQGRFCGACQKTVIDFTNRSDRELAAFFKKPMGSVCGRFHQDQLNREIAVPKKQIPWLRYFFHIAWPAFILMLKSCGPKDRVTSKAVTTLSVNRGTATNGNSEDVVVGALKVPDVQSFDITVDTITYVNGEIATIGIIDEPNTLTGAIIVVPDSPEQVKDSIVCTLPVEQADTSYVSLDTVTVTGWGTRNLARITMGAVASGISINNDSDLRTEIIPDDNGKSTVLAFPNPVQAGALLNIKLGNSDHTPLSVQLLTATGQRVMHKALKGTTHSPAIPIQLPANLTPGVYFVQIQYTGGSIDKSTVLVTR
jgi:hypothetical protein